MADSVVAVVHSYDMTNPRVPTPGDIKSAAQSAMEAAQSAVEAAQSVASTAMRIPPASAQVAAQLPDLLENLAVAIERLNTTIDRLDRYMALADPMFQTMDRIVPQLEALIALGNDTFRALSSIPGVGTLSRLAGLPMDDRDQTTAGEPKGSRSRRR
jgi:hypothetical protein